MPKAHRQNFLQGAFVLVIANALIKVIGAIFKIPLDNLVGADGMGLFTVAYNLYSAMFVLSTAGLPVAVSRMVSEANALGREREVKKIFSVSFKVFLVVGAAASLAMFGGAGLFVNAVKNTRAYASVLAIAPAIFFVAIMSVYRGYYQGLSNMYPTAVSQMIEAVSKLLIGYGFAYILLKLNYGVEYAAAGAILGITIGTVFGALYLIFVKKKSGDALRNPCTDNRCRTSKELLKTLIKVAIPITVGSAVLSITNLVDTFVVLGRLQSIGMTEQWANTLYGAYSVKAVSLMTMPQTLIVAFTISLIPAISSANAKKDYEKASKTADSALRNTFLIAFPCAVGLGTLSWPILNLLFTNTDEVNIAAPLLRTLSVAVLFIALVSVTNAILQAVGRELYTVATMLIGGVVKLTVNHFLIGIPSVNISGATVGTLCCYATIAILNLIIIAKKTKVAPKRWSLLLKPAAAAGIMGVFAYYINMFLSGAIGDKLSVVITILLAMVLYVILLLLLKAIYKEDVLMLPKGEKIACILKL